MKTLSTLVSTLTDITVEWNAGMNKLRVAEASSNRSLAVFGNDECYRLMPAVPKGQVIIRNSRELPDIARTLERAGIVKLVDRRVDSITRTDLFSAEVLID